MKAWGEARGNETLYIELPSIKAYDEIWPKWGKEMGLMLKFWEIAGEKSWSKEGEDVVTKEDLGLGDELFVDSKKAFGMMDRK